MTLRDAQQIAHGLIQGYIGPDHRVIDMSSFYSALAQALQTAYRQARNDRASGSKVPRSDNRVSGRDLNRPEQPAMIGSKRAGARATRSLSVITDGHCGGGEMKGDKDWQRVPGVLTDRLVVKVSPRAVRIVFGQVGETEVSFHTAVVMTRRNAVALAEAIQKLSAKSKGPDVRKATVSGGTVH